MSVFAEAGYLAHNKARQDHLASLGLPIGGRTVLEVGAGVGDHTQFFIDRGCQMTVTDGRPDNVEQIKKRFPGLDVRHLDIERDTPDDFPDSFEVIYCYGLLYHLGNAPAAINRMSNLCKSLLLLETCVAVNPEVNQLKTEDPLDPRNSIHGTACRPSRWWVQSKLQDKFLRVYLPITQPDHDEFPLDWSNAKGECRAVFVASRAPIINPLLTLELPMIQTRHR